MTTATGKSGRYKYYACHRGSASDPTQCDGRCMPMKKLDNIVLDTLAQHVLNPDRLETLLYAWLGVSKAAVEQRAAALKDARRRLTMLDGESANVIKLVRGGICSRPPSCHRTRQYRRAEEGDRR